MNYYECIFFLQYAGMPLLFEEDIKRHCKNIKID